MTGSTQRPQSHRFGEMRPEMGSEALGWRRKFPRSKPEPGSEGPRAHTAPSAGASHSHSPREQLRAQVTGSPGGHRKRLGTRVGRGLGGVREKAWSQPCAFSRGHVQPCPFGFWKGSAGGGKQEAGTGEGFCPCREESKLRAKERTRERNRQHKSHCPGCWFFSENLFAGSAPHAFAHSFPGRPRAPSAPHQERSRGRGGPRPREPSSLLWATLCPPKRSVQASPGTRKIRSLQMSLS